MFTIPDPTNVPFIYFRKLMKFGGEYISNGRMIGRIRFRLQCKIQHRGLCFIILFPYSVLMILCQ